MSITQQQMEATYGEGTSAMDHSIEHLNDELSKVRTGKASPAMLSSIMVSYYGTKTPLTQMANVGSSDSKTLTIQPWDKTAINDIERAIFEANLGFTPQNDGEMIRINIPALTEERRKQLVKHCKHLGEEAKVSLRTARHKLMDYIKKSVKDGYPEDMGKRMEARVEDMTHKYNDKVEAMVVSKSKDVMTV
jgi:ribosome recycling factor